MVSGIYLSLISPTHLNLSLKLASLTAWDWLLIFLAVVIIVWLLLIRNVKQSEHEATQFKAHSHEGHPE
jgi:uncharacterized protein (DUF983 family)